MADDGGSQSDKHDDAPVGLTVGKSIYIRQGVCYDVFATSPTVSKYKRVQDDGITFVFKFESAFPELLHVFVRHLMEPADAIDAWFGGTGLWNEANRRFETQHDGIGIYWYWIDEQKQVVMIASCFPLKGGPHGGV